MVEVDALIVGSRCAGAPLAMLLAQRGFSVLAVDRARFPSDTLSTHFLWPRTTSFLARWGLLDRLAATGCPEISSVAMHFGAVAVRGRPDAVEGVEAMYCPRRTVLDLLLVQAAREAGAEIREATAVRDLLWDGDRIVGAQLVGSEGKPYDIRARFVVGADGRNSLVAELARAELCAFAPPLTCGFYAYWRDVATDGVEFRIRAGRANLVFPTHDGLTCIWAGRSREGWEDYVANAEESYFATLDPALAERVRACERVTPFRGARELPNYYRRAFGPGWALVGDAAYHRDPLTGMGIGDAFLGASLLADALAQELTDQPGTALPDYETALRSRTQPVYDYTLQAAALRDPTPQAHLYERIAASPAAARALMNVMSGSLPAAQFFSRATLDRLLAPCAPHVAH